MIKSIFFAVPALVLTVGFPPLQASANEPVQNAREAVTDAVDPDCTPEKAVKGAAVEATVGLKNRCDAAETARDVTGTDGKLDDLKDRETPKPAEKLTQ